MVGFVDSSPFGAILELIARVSVLLLIAHAVLFVMRRRGSGAAIREQVARWISVVICVLPFVVLSDCSIGVLPRLWSPDPMSWAELEPVLPLALLGVDPTSMTHSSESSGSRDLTAWLVAAWILGTIVILAHSAIGHFLATRRLLGSDATGLPAALRDRLRVADWRSVRVSPAASQPVAVGVLLPRIVLPPAFLDWPLTRQRAVLEHERAHVERRDGVAVLVGQVARAIWWFHPLVWTLGRTQALAREQACDDQVLDGGFCATDYAAELVDVARELRSHSPRRSTVLAMTTTSQIEARVHALLRSDAVRSAPRAWLRVSIACLALVVGFVCAAGEVIAQDDPPPIPPPPPPTEELEQQDPDAGPITIAITERDRVVYDGREVGIDGVKPLVTKLFRGGVRPVIVQCASGTSAGVVVRVIDEAKTAGARKVSIATVRPEGAVLTLAEVTVKPRPLYRPAPRLTESLRKRVPARVSLTFIVDEKGRVTDPKVHESSDAKFDAVALEAIRKWRFEPGKRDGRAVPTRLRIPMNFPAAASAQLVDARVIHQVVPKMTAELRKHAPATVRLAFVVDTKGEVHSPQVIESTDARFDRAALDAIEQWRFEPGTRNGKPVTMEMRLPIVFPAPKTPKPSRDKLR